MSYTNFAEFYDILTDNVDYNNIAFYYCGLLKKYGAEGGSLLDIGCGTGNLTLRMERLGFKATGCDLSKNMLELASKKSSTIKWIRSDMRRLPFENSFDCAVATLDSLNHLSGREAVKEAFDAVYKSLRKGGIFAADINTPYKHQNILANNVYTFDYEEEGLYCIWENEQAEKDPLNRIDMYLEFFCRQRNGLYKRFSDSLFEIALPYEDIEEMLVGAGFEILECSEYLTGGEPKEDSHKLTVAAKKP